MTQLTVKGAAITPAQQSAAKLILAIGTRLGANTVAQEAAIFAAIEESDLGAATAWNPTYGGLLGGNVSYFGKYGAPSSQAVWTAQINAFYKGGEGYQDGGAIAASASITDPSLLAPQITAPFDTDDPAPYGQYLRQGGLTGIRRTKREAQQIVINVEHLDSGGLFGAGGTGLMGNTASDSQWVVGDSSNPDQDFWTTMNQYAMDGQMYLFSDGEALYLADGFKLLGQTPAALICLYDPAVISAQLTYDNTSFNYTASTVVNGKPQRRATLARTTSPTECEIKIVCDIDKYRGGDTVILQQFGPADGVWLVGECVRSVFQVYSTLTLVQGMMPMNALSGTPLGAAYLTGSAATRQGAGTVIEKIVAEANTIDSANVPYEFGGGHTQVGVESIGIRIGNHEGGYGTAGFDCSGAVAAVLNAGGLWPAGAGVPSDQGIVSTLHAARLIRPGTGPLGAPSLVIYDNPGVHIFMRINGQIWGTSDGGGVRVSNGMSAGGGAWVTNGPDVNTFQAWHVPQSILGQQVTTVAAGGANVGSIPGSGG